MPTTMIDRQAWRKLLIDQDISQVPDVALHSQTINGVAKS